MDETLASLVLRELVPHNAFYCHVNCDAGQMLFSRGERSSGVLILIDGLVKLLTDSVDGKRLTLRIVEPEEILELAPAFTGMPHEFTAEAVSHCRLVSIPSDSFRDILHRNRRALSAVALELSLNYHYACSRLQIVACTLSISARLARLLLEWSKSGPDKTARGVQIRLKFCHREIGEFIGASRETVTRTLSEFERRNVIQIRGSILTITNLQLLGSYAGISVFSDEPA
jgi:CRP/FNR family transcriptional regulator